MSRAKPTKTRLSGDRRRAEIVDAAEAVFGRKGFDATRMNDIAEASGVATGLLYKHFPSKDELFAAVIERQAENLATRITAAVSAASNPVDAAMDVWFSVLERPEFHTVDPGGHPGYAELRDRFAAIVTDALRAVYPSATEDRLRLAAAAVVGAAEAAGEAWRAQPGTLSRTEASELAATFVVGGLTALD